VFNHGPEFEREFGVPHEIVRITDSKDLKLKLEYLTALNPDEIQARQKASRRWVEKCFSFQVVGDKLVNIIEKYHGKLARSLCPSLVGEGAKVWHPEKSVIRAARIGERTSIASLVELGPTVIIGADCKIQAFAYLPPGVSVGDRVFIGQGVRFCNDKHPSAQGAWDLLPTVVEDDVSIGAGAVILPGIILGRGCVIGAGAVVTKSIPPERIWYGNPATDRGRAVLRGSIEEGTGWQQLSGRSSS
jgi:UDP-2-acetamido-3-amino-2,3-dideoxy-glucuronate N-acetyltransferase